MKTKQLPVPVRNLNENLALLLFMSIMLILSLFQDANAQGEDRFKNDPYFPGKHKFTAGVITSYTGTTPPPVLIADVTYGVSNKFSFGIVGGTTGNLALCGFRLHANLLEHNNFRLLYRMTNIYYFERNGTFLFDKTNKQVMPWMLTLGMLDAEWRFATLIVILKCNCDILEKNCETPGISNHRVIANNCASFFLLLDIKSIKV